MLGTTHRQEGYEEDVEPLVEPTDGLVEGWLQAKADSRLPSQLLDAARQVNPELEIEIDYRSSAVIIVKTDRGEVWTNRGPNEDWLRTFRRAGLL
jgi:hypothetical protein